MNIFLPYDILFNIALNGNNKTAINILLANKKLYYDYFHNVFCKRYPELLLLKRTDETLKALYFRMLHYIELLQEEFNIIYKGGNPILTYGFKKHRTENINLLFLNSSEKGDLEMVRTSLEAGANIHTMDDHGLIWASMNGHLSVVQYLVEKGADIHSINNGALRMASQYGHLSIVKYLVEKGGDIRAQNDSALKMSSFYGHLEIVKYLAERGANIHAEDDWAIRVASNNRHLHVVKYLVEKGAGMGGKDIELLKWASTYGHLESARYLI